MQSEKEHSIHLPRPALLSRIEARLDTPFLRSRVEEALEAQFLRRYGIRMLKRMGNWRLRRSGIQAFSSSTQCTISTWA